MHDFIIQFLILIITFSIILSYIGKIGWYRKDMDIDSRYLDDDGDHIYYDRSLIEKKTFRKRFPDITNLRSFKQLFKKL